MTNKKIELLNKMLEAETLYKMAQEVGSGEGEVDQATADRLANEIFDKLFDDEFKRLMGES
jgi:uncharacterized protein Yka (UPF0111/DUF47 family)